MASNSIVSYILRGVRAEKEFIENRKQEPLRWVWEHHAAGAAKMGPGTSHPLHLCSSEVEH